MKKIGYGLVVLLAVALITPTHHSEATQQGGKLQKLMDDKLRYAKMLLEAVSLGEFDKVSRSSEKLIQISQTAEWAVHKTPRYELHSNEFRRAAESLIKKAKDKNIDGVAYGYVELTMTCFRCHQYVREVVDVNATVPSVAPRFD